VERTLGGKSVIAKDYVRAPLLERMIGRKATMGKSGVTLRDSVTQEQSI